ncbi:SEC-C metal-binding domain-containing protein [Corynebacterium diphtheriae]
MMNCPCGSGTSYSDCCQPFHTKAKNAPTAELLMRSRY